MKIHHFDLSNTINDVELLAETTKLNLRRSVRKLGLRDKLKKKGSLSPTYDLKIWKYEIKSQIADLGVSLERCNEIVKVLKKIQEDCARTQDDLDKEIQYVK